jgi:SAM-dependent methyltransferase
LQLKNIKDLWKILKYKRNIGYCPICEGKTIFIEYSSWLRDNYRCLRCNSIPRQRAIIKILKEKHPHYSTMNIHESSPCGPASDKIRKQCTGYVSSQFYLGVTYGSIKNGFRCENLEEQTFVDDLFDIVITQDVMEHILNPAKAFAEIARTLKPGGTHIFTVPLYAGRKTLVRAIEENGTLKHLQPADYHKNPINLDGSLVVREWGDDMVEFIRETSGVSTQIYLMHDRKLGIDGNFLEVFVSVKPA